MAIEQIDIESFLDLSIRLPIFDVRSPAEFSHAQIPGAFSLPLFTDEQRKIIGTAYKQQSRQAAVQEGLEFFSERMKLIPKEVEQLLNNWNNITGTAIRNKKANQILVHCWRGGMRSGAVAWLLDLYGFKVYTLKGGYKSFRNWALAQFEKEYRLNILGGYTGSGKTLLLQQMKQNGIKIIDLEKLANHKGSAFGSLGEKPQTGQEMFENLLAVELYKMQKIENDSDTNGNAYPKKINEIWIEDESRHIGTVGIPNAFWNQMRKSSLFFLDIPFEERLKYIVSGYGSFSKDQLTASILKIQKRLGGLETKNAINFLYKNNIAECFSILLKYYDKLYGNSLLNRENVESILNKIPCPCVDLNNIRFLHDQSVTHL